MKLKDFFNLIGKCLFLFLLALGITIAFCIAFLIYFGYYYEI